MGTTGKQQMTPPRTSATPPQQQQTPVDTRALREDTFAASKAYLKYASEKKLAPRDAADCQS